MKKISVILPCYNSESFLDELCSRLKEAIKSAGFEYEILLINDHSPQNDWECICRIAKNDFNVKGISFAKNKGQHTAIYAGIEFACGDYICVMDADLQDPPEEIPNLIEELERKKTEIVFARRKNRKDSWLNRLTSSVFYKSLSYFTGEKLDPNVANYCMFTKKTQISLLKIKEIRKFLPVMLRWTGLRFTYLNFEHRERAEGKSNYNFYSRLKLAIDILTYYSNRPLNMLIKLGALLAFASSLLALYIVVRTILEPATVPGWASIFTLVSFLGGCNIAFLGFLGLYVGNIFDEVKNRPQYIVDTCANIDRDKN